MRETKFRAKRIDNNEWVYGNLLVNSCTVRIVCFDYIIDEHSVITETYVVDGSTVGQYTGLKDKNGVEIYECDIVKIQYLDEMGIDDEDNYIFTDECSISKIGNDLEVSTDFGDYDCTLLKWAIEQDYICEVIGNIYENPELLECTK